MSENAASSPSNQNELLTSTTNTNVLSDVSPLSPDMPKTLSPGEPEASSTVSGATVIVKPSGIPPPKASGLKPPSKIGRPCLGQAKPALPPTPKNGPETEGRRDEYRRQKLTDVEEEVDENDGEVKEKRPETPSPRKTRNYSVSSNMSMDDTLWDLHPRRLSEAGLRRHSDTSVVLTEDTDCFIIGMKVWVGGTKPGQIAYLGETQFAPGEWAGIVLDEPIGKNDGSVSGTRYFQCEPKRGVFSRLTRLTLAPLPEAAEASAMLAPSANGTRKSPTSPTGSTRSLIHRASPSLNTSTTSLSSSHHDFKIGDRVIVQSSQGSKPGTLRYIGATDFAKGEWCGVELDDPLGKNDGAVEGKRYFTCQAKFGLFAPLSKVSKSPSSRKPSGQCVVHKSGTAGSSIRRAGSRESMTSMTSMTSATSSVRRVRLGVTSLSSAKKPVPQASSAPLSKTPLQDVLREKEHHIEQLLKEREIDRSEITKAINHAEQVEGKLLNLQEEYERYRLESETKFREHLSLLSQLEKKCENLTGQLEDERKKLEDAQFRFEEEILTKDDIEVANKSNLIRIQELEEFLKVERLKNEKLEQETKRMFETEEMLSKIQEEMDALQKAQEKVNKNILDKELEVVTLKEKLEEMNLLLTEEKKRVEKKDANIENLVTENNTLTQEKDKIIDRLKEELHMVNKLLKEKHIGNELSLLKELKKVEMSLSAKTFDCEALAEKVKELEKKILQLETELKHVESPESESEKERKWKLSLEELRNILKVTVSELIKVKKECALQVLEKEMALREKDIKLNYEILEIEKLKTDFNQTINDITQSSKYGKERYMKQIETRNKQIDELLSSLQNTSKELVSRHTVTAKLQEEISEKNQLITKLKSELETYTSVKADQNNYIKKLTEQLKLSNQKSVEWERKYHNAEEMILQLREIKQQHELQFRSIIEASKDSNAQLAIFNEEMRRTEQNLENLRLEMTKKLDAAFNTEQELKFSLKVDTERYEIEKAHLEKQLKVSQEAEGILEEKLRLSTNEALKAQEKLNQYIIDLTKNLERNELEAKKQLDANSDKIRELEQILEITIAEGERSSSALTRRIDELTSERDQLRLVVKEKTEQLIEAEEKLKASYLNQETVHVKQINNLKADIDQYKQKLEETNTIINMQSQEIETMKNLRTTLEQQINEQTQQIKNLNELKLQSDQAYSKVNEKLTEAEEKVAELTKQISDLNDGKKNFEIILSDLRDQILVLTNELRELQIENTNIKNTITEKDQHMSHIQDEIKQIKSHKNSLESKLSEKENKLIALTVQLEEIIKEKGNTSETFAAQENKILELNMELQKTLQEKAALNNEVTEKDNVIVNIKEEFDKKEQQLNVKIKEYENEINHSKQKNETLQKQKEESLKVIANTEENIASVTTDLKNVQTEKAKLEKLINENEQQISQLKEELKKLDDSNVNYKDKIISLENLISEKESKINNLETELQKYKEQWEQPNNNPVIQEINAKLEDTNKLLQEKELEIKSLNSQLEAADKVKGTDSEIINIQEKNILDLNNQIQKLLDEKNVAQKQIIENDNKIVELQEEIVNRETLLNNTIKEKEHEVTLFKDKIEILMKESENSKTTAYDTTQEIDKLNKRIAALLNEQKTLETTVNEKENKLLQLNEELQKTKEQNLLQSTNLQQLETSVKENENIILNLKNDLQKRKQEWEQPTNNPVVLEINKKLKDNEKILSEKETELSLLNTKIQTMTEQNQQLQQTWQLSVQQWKEKLLNLDKFKKFTSKEYNSLQEQINLLKREMENVEKIENGLQKDTPLIQFDDFKKQIDSDRKELQKAVKNAQLILLEKQKELNEKENEFKKLQKQLMQVQEESATPVSVQVTGNTQKPVKDKQDNTCDMNSYQKMMEEKEFALGQVQFLNSIIVDMQNKNKELQSKIQLLENGYFAESPPEEDKLNINRVIPPRKYCDICEMFDLHETEDCPVQMTDESVVVRDPNRVLPEPRPYCEICEEFGHDTANCDADETY